MGAAVNRNDARTIAHGLLADGLDVSTLTPQGRRELRFAIDRLLALANVGLTDMERMAIACGNEPYADYRVCPHCGGSGKV